MEILRNLYRRRLRTGLTVLGIAVGILAFTVMGAMAEKFNRLIAGGRPTSPTASRSTPPAAPCASTSWAPRTSRS